MDLIYLQRPIARKIGSHPVDLETVVLGGLAATAGIHVLYEWIAQARRGIRSRKGASSTHLSVKAWPTVSIIIPAWQEKGTIESCIKALSTVDYPDWEAIVVAGGPDGTFQAAGAASQGLKNFQVIQQSPGGKNAALNAGTKVAKGEVLVILDADSQICAGWLQALVAPLTEHFQASTGKSLPQRETAFSLSDLMERIDAYEVKKIVTLRGDTIALRRSLLNAIGGFPEEVKVGVDWDLSARLASRDIECAYCPDAIVVSSHPATLGEYWRNEVRWRRAHLQSLFRLHNYFLRSPLAVISSFYLYALAWFWVVFTILATALLLAGETRIFAAWGIFTAWILLRRAALAMDIACYTRERRWLKIAWAPAVLLLVTFLAIPPASLTWKKRTTLFKGPRYNDA